MAEAKLPVSTGSQPASLTSPAAICIAYGSLLAIGMPIRQGAAFH
jgi:hypothetical protein